MKKISTLFYDEKYQGAMVLTTALLLASVILGSVLFLQTPKTKGTRF